MRWKKLGNIFRPENESDWMVSHAAVPIADYLGDDLFRIYFSTRDRQNRSSTGYFDMDITRPGKIQELSGKPVLSPGAIGCFDDSGAMASCIVNLNRRKLLYYVGWNLGTTVPFRNSIGLAEWDASRQEFVRCFEGPIIDRSRDEPHFTSSNHVIVEDGVFRMWYQSCVGWYQNGNQLLHKYHIKYAESDDGIRWRRNQQVAIDFRDRYEYALSVPRIIRDEGIYRMWFSSRAEKNIATYRIRYAESEDGIHWIRQNYDTGIDVSATGWDSEMICYPYIFDHKGARYLLYNGNNYSETGIGLAILAP